MKLNLCWLYAISKYGYPPSIEDTFRVIEEAANLGFHYMEMEGVRERNMKEVYQHRKAIKDACESRGVKIMNFCPILPELVSLDEAERRKGFELYKMGLEIATFLGAELVQIDSFTPPLKFHGNQPYKESIDYGLDLKVEIDPDFDWDEQWAVLVETFTEAAELAKEAGLKLCVEPRVGEMISNTDSALRLLDHVQSENLGIVLDTGHQHAQKEVLPLSVEKLKDKIFYLHVADNDGKVNEHRALGEGSVDWEGVFQALKKHGFDGYVGIDVGKVPDLDGAILKSKVYLENLCNRLGIELEV
ncbi:MAG TPA: hypothetical protein DHV12_07805 [Thermotogae bacterium]|nr:hypothetical protein [Thermotogota bacterium]